MKKNRLCLKQEFIELNLQNVFARTRKNVSNVLSVCAMQKNKYYYELFSSTFTHALPVRNGIEQRRLTFILLRNSHTPVTNFSERNNSLHFDQIRKCSVYLTVLFLKLKSVLGTTMCADEID